MKAAKKILCPTDFSDCARDALQDAADLAELTGATLAVLHVYQNPAYVMPVGAYLEPAASALSDLRDGLVDELAKLTEPLEAKGLQVETLLLEGVPYQEIVDHAKKWGADLIVMGTHGRSGFQRALIGSVAERVVRLAHCPVFVSRGAAS